MPTRQELKDHFDNERDARVHDAAAARTELRRREEQYNREGPQLTKPQEVERIEELRRKLSDADETAKQAIKRAAEYKRTHP